MFLPHFMNVPIETFFILCYIIFERTCINMNKNYYDILQVNKNASPEIIEKAYKILAKKYHPDLQPEEQKKQGEELLKEINEAYEVLSNPEKKKIYDNSLLKEASKNSESNSYNEDYDDTYPNSIPIHELKYRQQQQELLRQQKLKQEQQYQQQLQREKELAYQEQLQQAKQKAYYDAYIQDLKNRGYKIRYKKSIKDYIKDFTSILLTLFILFLLWQIPFVHNFFIQLLEENELLSAFLKK